MLKSHCRAYTLTELLVVVAIIMMLAALLFPVFTSAKNQAKGAQCLSNFRQISAAAALYVSDYSEYVMPANHQLALEPNSRNDRTWVQLLLPYEPAFRSYFCPMAPVANDAIEAAFDFDLIAGDADSRYYTASKSVNFGYNYQNLAPILMTSRGWVALPRSISSISEPANTFFFLDSASTQESGPPRGGSWLVVAPCRLVVDGTGAVTDAFSGSGRMTEVSSISEGWVMNDATSPLTFGGAWPWHNNRVHNARIDGSVASTPAAKLATGCDVKPEWAGLITDTTAYAWDGL